MRRDGLPPYASVPVPGPVARIVGAIVLVLLIGVGVMLGAIFLGALLVAGAIAYVALRVRLWWVGTQLGGNPDKQNGPQVRAWKDRDGHSVIETEYEVLDDERPRR